MYNYLNQSCGPFDKLETDFNKEINEINFYHLIILLLMKVHIDNHIKL